MITSLRRAAIGVALVGSALLVSGAAAVAAPTAPATVKPLSTLVVKSQYFTTGEITLTCDPGKVATGGGVGVDDPAAAYVARTEPFPNTGTPTGWKGTIWNLPNRGSTPSSGAIYVVCASVG